MSLVLAILCPKPYTLQRFSDTGPATAKQAASKKVISESFFEIES
jgi:hypothetical protein|tara:strand:- start:749 stop:883 length:135 start_codon:yes stop_codon:yes gene_type:complete